MNFFLPSFFDYLQNQPSLNIVQQQFEYVNVETASISTMLLTILLLLSTVEGVVLFFTTLYSWCLFPIHIPRGDNNGDDDGSNDNRQRQRRRRRLGSHGGEHHLFWWLDIDYESDLDDDHDDDETDDEEDDDVFEDESWNDYVVGNDVRGGKSPRRMNRYDRIQMSLQEHAFQETQSEDCCAICLGDFQSNDRVVSATQPCCRSQFHYNCLEQWLKIQNSCPCCRKNILLKTKEIMSRKQKGETENQSINVTQTPIWETSDAIVATNRQHQSAQFDVSDIQLTPTRRSSDDMADISPEMMPELSISGSWDQFWFLVF